MNLIKLLTYLFALKIDNYKERFGNDERHPLIEENLLLPKIIENYEKKGLLEYLQSNNVTTIYKIQKIKDFYGNSQQTVNLLNGGLLDDWNFEI